MEGQARGHRQLEERHHEDRSTRHHNRRQRQTLRFYEHQGLLPEPARTPSGYRNYPEDATARVNFVRAAQAAGLKLAQIGEILDIRDQGRPPCEHVRTLVTDRLDEVEQRLADLNRTRSELLAIADRLDHLESADCTTYCDAV